MFELLVVSSEDTRFVEWIKCFELLFDVPGDQILSDYNELFTLVNKTTNTYEYKNGLPMDATQFGKSVNEFDWTTLDANRNRFQINYYFVLPNLNTMLKYYDQIVLKQI